MSNIKSNDYVVLLVIVVVVGLLIMLLSNYCNDGKTKQSTYPMPSMPSIYPMPSMPSTALPDMTSEVVYETQYDVPYDVPSNVLADLPSDVPSDVPSETYGEFVGYPDDVPLDIPANVPQMPFIPTGIPSMYTMDMTESYDFPYGVSSSYNVMSMPANIDSMPMKKSNNSKGFGL